MNMNWRLVSISTRVGTRRLTRDYGSRAQALDAASQLWRLGQRPVLISGPFGERIETAEILVAADVINRYATAFERSANLSSPSEILEIHDNAPMPELLAMLTAAYQGEPSAKLLEISDAAKAPTSRGTAEQPKADAASGAPGSRLSAAAS